MLKILFIIFSSLVYLQTFAESTIVGNISYSELRDGRGFNYDTISVMIMGAINFFMGLAGTIAIIFIIIGAYFYMFGDLADTKQKGKDTIFKAIVGFAIASLAWVIIRFIIDNFN